jgi:hypothetical protein
MTTSSFPNERTDAWPEGYFEAIRIDDEAFTRPEQGDWSLVDLEDWQ